MNLEDLDYGHVLHRRHKIKYKVVRGVDVRSCFDCKRMLRKNLKRVALYKHNMVKYYLCGRCVEKEMKGNDDYEQRKQKGNGRINKEKAE